MRNLINDNNELGAELMISESEVNSVKLLDTIFDIISYIRTSFDDKDTKIILSELAELCPNKKLPLAVSDTTISYEELQNRLSSLNEKESIRKIKGVYYTSTDVVNYIISNSIVELYDGIGSKMLSPGKILESNIPESFCFEKVIYDPTCGAGEFLLATLNIKIDLFQKIITSENISNVISTIRGNDINKESILITKLRLFLCVLERLGVEMIKGIGNTLNSCFTSEDFISSPSKHKTKYDIIVGNPPYVETSKSGLKTSVDYGNVYANVLDNAARILNDNGVIGFIIPLSYISTPRMNKIRDALFKAIPEQYILSFSDRPDCLFVSVHQKLCIVIGKKTKANQSVYTNNYTYWYKEERKNLFSNLPITKNQLISPTHIPKFGNRKDINIYNKICKNKVSLSEIMNRGNQKIYVNMRATFWIKAFLSEHTSGEYKAFSCSNDEEQSFIMCLLNSSLFWWYWICTSDCWHLTQKEFDNFKIPQISEFTETKRLSELLEKKLETTKVYVGTKQTEYEYKHKSCIDEIHLIDDYINKIYGLTAEESKYIKDFAYRYRMSGGPNCEDN